MSNSCSTCGEELAHGLCPRCAATMLAGGLDASSEGADLALPLPHPRSLGPYELLEEIARGGMGVVYRARQPSLDREVAVKVILAGPFAGEHSLARFRAEAEAVAHLHHPNIVAVHDFGESGGHHWFSMEFVAGSTLAALTRDGPLPPRTAARYLARVADAVQHAHEQGVLHRDLKPGNVLVDASDNPRVTDFGLAKRLDREETITVTGQLLGTPGFAPPEQWVHRLGPVTVRSDVYGLGAVLYHLLTGRPPFLAGSLPETVQQVLDAEPAPPRTLNPAVPPDLETICLRCLAKEPARRYPSARAFGQELQRWLDGEPIHSRPTPAWERLWLWGRRRPATAGVIALISLMLVALVAALASSTLRIRAAQGETVAKLRQAYRQQARAERQLIQAGRRFRTLDALSSAAALNPTPAEKALLRDDFLTTLSIPDLNITRTLNTNGNPLLFPTRSHHGSLLAGATPEGALLLVDAASGEVLARLPANGHAITMVHAFSRDDELLAATHDDGRTRIWSVPDRECVFTFDGSPRFEAIDFGPDNHQVAAVVANTNVVVWSRPAFQTLSTVSVSFAAHYVRFSPDGRRLAVSSYDRNLVELFETTGFALGTIAFPRAVGEVDWHPDGTLLAVATVDGPVQLCDTRSLQVVRSLTGHQTAVGNVVFSPDGRHLLSSGWDGTFLWDTISGEALSHLAPAVGRLRFGPDGRTVFLATWLGHQVHECRFSGADEARFIPGVENAGEIGDFALHPSMDLVAASQGNAVWLRDLDTGRELARLPTGPVAGLTFDRDGSRLVVSGSSGVAVWPIQIREGAIPVFGPPRTLLSEADCREIALARDKPILAVAHQTHVHLFDLDSERPIAVTPAHPSSHLHRLALSADGRWLATSGWASPKVGVWEVAKGRLKAYLSPPGNDALGVPSFDPGGQWLAVSYPNRLLVHDLGTLEPLRESPLGESHLLQASDHGDLLAAREAMFTLVLADPEGSGIRARLQGLAHRHIHRAKWTRNDSLLLLQTSGPGNTGGILCWNLARIRPQLARAGLDWLPAAAPAPGPQATPSPTVVRVIPPAEPDATGGQPAPVRPIAPRDPGLEPALVDLSAFFNASLDAPWHQNTGPGSDFSRLPRGRTLLEGRPFDLRGIVQAGALDPNGRPYPRTVGPIPIPRQPVERLHFLHAAIHGDDSGIGTRIGHYEVRFTDGRTLEIPIVLGRDVNDWWSKAGESAEPRIAWSGLCDASAAQKRRIRLFLGTWENPRPTVPMASVSLVGNDLGTAPFLVALTAE